MHKIDGKPFVRVTLPDGKEETIYGFNSRADAIKWIRCEAVVWFYNKRLEEKKAAGYAVALHQMFYNFVRIHQTLKMTPAMAAGVTDKLWEIEDVVGIIEAWEAEQAVAGITYEIEKEKIGNGYLVRIKPRYEEPQTKYGFATREVANQYVEKDRASHKPGRRKKLTNAA
jgi:hypothetical protein